MPPATSRAFVDDVDRRVQRGRCLENPEFACVGRLRVQNRLQPGLQVGHAKVGHRRSMKFAADGDRQHAKRDDVAARAERRHVVFG